MAPRQDTLTIVSFETARTWERANEIMAAWGSRSFCSQKAAPLGLSLAGPILDGIEAVLCGGGPRARAGGRSCLTTSGFVIAWLQWVAGGLDAVENTALLAVLDHRTTHDYPLVAASPAGGEFVLVGLGIAFVLIALLVGGRQTATPIRPPSLLSVMSASLVTVEEFYLVISLALLKNLA